MSQSCSAPHDFNGLVVRCVRNPGHDGRHGYAGMFWGNEIRPLGDEELQEIGGVIEQIVGERCTLEQARRIAEELDLEVEVDHYGPEVGYSASRWITSWSKDQ